MKNRWWTSIVSVLLIITGCEVNSQENGGHTLDNIEVDTIITGLNVPWEIQWGPDGWIWMTERYGLVSRVDPEDGAKEVVLDIRDEVYQSGESGMLGMALHPDFNDTSHVFVVYTYLNEGVTEKMVRYEYDGTGLVNPVTMIDDIPGNSTHDGSRLLILPDYTILMTTGDAQNQSAPQDLSSLAGKTLRLNLDGTVPVDNPIEGSPVWSWGHRNAQGLMLAPNGKIYSSEHGPTTDDEINILDKGKNYGWPNVHGYCDTPNEEAFCNENNVVGPIKNWTPTIAPSDIIWYDDPAIPEFRNTLLMAVLKEKMIVQIQLSENGTEVISTREYFKNDWGRLRDILQGPDGEIYIATNGASWSNVDPGTHSILRLKKANGPTAVIQHKLENSIQIFPNPAVNDLNISLTGNAFAIFEIAILDITGKTIKKATPMHTIQALQIDIASLAAGTYQLIVQTDKGLVRKKFVKN